MAYDIENLPQRINIGASGTNRQRIFQFDVSKWIEKWPEATFNICVQRPTESEDEPYFGDISLEDGILYWIVHYADTENVGNGWMEIHAFIPGEDELFAKSKRVVTVIEQSLCNTAGDTPEPSEPWVSRVEQAAANALEAAGDAEGYAGTAQSSATSAAGSAQSAATSAGNAGTSAQAAAGSASAAAGSATAAAGSAASALAAADSASASSAAANTAKNRAAASATDAEASAQDAQTQVIAAEAAADRAEAAAGGFVIDRSLTKSGISADAKVTGNRLTNLEYALAGYAFREQEDDDDAYTKVVPASAMPYAELEMIGGRTVVWNRSPQTVYATAQSSDGIDYTRIDDSTCRIHGTNTLTGNNQKIIFQVTNGFTVPNGHEVYFFGFADLTQFGITGSGFYWQPFGYLPRDSADCILTSDGTYATSFYINVQGEKTLDITIHPQFVDLTQMFGAGHEPTLEQCRQIFAAGNYTYSAPTIKHAGVTGVKTVGKNMLKLDNDRVKNYQRVTWQLDGYNGITVTASGTYGRVMFEVSDDLIVGETYTISAAGIAGTADRLQVYIENDETYSTDPTIRYGVLHQMGKSLTFVATKPLLFAGFYATSANGTAGDMIVSGLQLEKGNSHTTYSPYISSTYAIPAAVQALDGYGWSAGDVCNSIEWDGEKWWFVERVGRQSSLDDAYVFYELATPTRTDITSLMNMDGYINVEAGGTVTFEHALGTADNIRVPVPNKETFLIKLPGGGA